jgi:hypothetical protein
MCPLLVLPKADTGCWAIGVDARLDLVSHFRDATSERISEDAIR